MKLRFILIKIHVTTEKKIYCTMLKKQKYYIKSRCTIDRGGGVEGLELSLLNGSLGV